MHGFVARTIPNLVVFLSGLAIMVLELVASRLVAKHLGSSLEIWTTVIGVILAGMSLGNYWGGRLSDLRSPLATLPYLVGGAAILSLSVLLTNDVVGGSALMAALPQSLRIVGTITIIFFPAACVLGTIQPTIARWAIEQSTRTGSAFGNVGAWGTAGNILGTFLTGFVLLSSFGVKSIVVSSVAVLGVTAVGLLAVSLLWPAPELSMENRPTASNKFHKDPKQDEGWTRFMPNLFVFTSGLSIMMVELVGSRLLSHASGTSIYSWTSLIGIVLAGISIGNYLGGKIADRFDPARTLPHLFLIASILCALLLMGDTLLKSPSVGSEFVHWVFRVSPDDLSRTNSESSQIMNWLMPSSIFASVFILFLAPTCALGTISPVAAKLALERADKAGQAIGNVYAWGAIGSIVGSFLTGFLLISLLGTKAVICTVAGLLALISVCMVTSGLGHAVWAGILLATTIAVTAPESWQWATGIGHKLKLRDLVPPGETHRESNYYFIKVQDSREHSGAKELVLDNLVHGYVLQDKPRDLRYDYELIYASIMERAGAIPIPDDPERAGAANSPARKLKTLFIGGGSYTYPRYIDASYPGSSMLVMEIDPAVTRMVQDSLFLPEDTPIETRWGDARSTVDHMLAENQRAVRQQQPKPYEFDFVFGDAFNDFSVPWHLTTLEFNEKMKDLLSPDGVYMINIIDNYKYSRFLGAYVQTARKSFANTAVFCTANAGPTSNRETFVIAMSRNADMDYLDLGTRRGEREFEGSLLTDAQVQEAIRRCQFADPWYRRRYLTKEQESTASSEAAKQWESERQSLSDEIDRLTREAKTANPEDKKRVTEAKRRLREHTAAKRRHIENHVREYAERPDTLTSDQLAKIEVDLRKVSELILTDDYAPVENLLAPVARERDL
jgi:spermidine synthase/MFS family permease